MKCQPKQISPILCHKNHSIDVLSQLSKLTQWSIWPSCTYSMSCGVGPVILISYVKASCHNQFTHAYSTLQCIFKILIICWSNQDKLYSVVSTQMHFILVNASIKVKCKWVSNVTLRNNTGQVQKLELICPVVLT